MRRCGANKGADVLYKTVLFGYGGVMTINQLLAIMALLSIGYWIGYKEPVGPIELMCVSQVNTYLNGFDQINTFKAPCFCQIKEHVEESINVSCEVRPEIIN